MSQLKLLRVNPRYRISGTTSNFTMGFGAIDLDTVQSIALVDATLNRAFPNIYAPNNVFVIRITGAGPVVVDYPLVIPPLQYTAQSLATAVQAAITGMGITNVTVTYSIFPVDRFVWTWDGTGPQIGVTIVTDQLATGSTLATISQAIGNMTNLVLVATVPQNSEAPPALSGPDEVYIQSNLIASGHCVDVPQLDSFIPYLGKISFVDTPFGFSANYQATEAELQEVNYKLRSGINTLRTFDIFLCDRYGNNIPTPDNCFIDMHFAFFQNPGRD